MRTDKIRLALSECERFKRAAHKYLEREKEDKYAHWGCAESGAMRRASLDLTRALAEMRKT